ncbi:hypothetical protein BFP97_16895 [Roseivirga sp. 4D4]|nr:hypothetical protein BFP97_16895 [Roseivirga sp. 4D4]
MSGVLKALVTNSGASAAEVASPFGFGAPFTNKYKTWLQKTGLIKGKVLTPYGEVVFKIDPKLESAITQWFMHHQLIKNPIDAEAWYFFIMEFLPQHDSFSRTQLETALEMKLMSHSVEHFSKGRPMNRVISKKLIDCYLLEEGLGGLGLLKQSKDNEFVRQNPKNSLGPWNSPQSLLTEY